MADAKETPVRQPAEVMFARELAELAKNDEQPKPPGWRLSPRAVRTFILGSGGEPVGKSPESIVRQKFYGDDMLVDRCIVSLMGNRGLLLVGEPGTAKSMLSELLAAAISGSSIQTIQGTVGTTEDQIKYSWNYALLLAEGPTQRSLVPAPIYTAMRDGSIVRFEELTRCPPETQDTLVSILSDKMLHIPELGDDSVLYAKRGFNIIATANLRDRGVHEMSSALKRRFNFETVHPIRDARFERALVMEQAKSLLDDAAAPIAISSDVVDLLVTTFSDLRQGRTEEGTAVEKPAAILSTAEAVSVAFSAGLDAYYFGAGEVKSEHLVRQFLGTIVKDNPDDAKRLRQYFDVVVKSRAKSSAPWKRYFEARKLLE